MVLYKKKKKYPFQRYYHQNIPAECRPIRIWNQPKIDPSPGVSRNFCGVPQATASLVAVVIIFFNSFRSLVGWARRLATLFASCEIQRYLWIWNYERMSGLASRRASCFIKFILIINNNLDSSGIYILCFIVHTSTHPHTMLSKLSGRWWKKRERTQTGCECP